MSCKETTSPLATQPVAIYLPPTPTTSHPSLIAIQSQPLHCEHYQRLTPNLTHHKELHREELFTPDTTGNPPKSQPSQGATQKLLIHCLNYKRLPITHLSLGATQRQPHHCQHKERTAPHTPHKELCRDNPSTAYTTKNTITHLTKSYT